MASTSFIHSPIMSKFDPLFRIPILIKPKSYRNKHKAFAHKSSFGDHSHNFHGRLVDEGMIVLRKRMHEMRINEAENGNGPPREWMDWEKEFFAGYDSMICDAVGHLQSYFMETRPSVAIGMAALVALSVPTSVVVVVYNLLWLIKGALGGFHLS